MVRERAETGECLRLCWRDRSPRSIRETEVYVSRASARDPLIPSYPGRKISTLDASRSASPRVAPDDQAWSKLPQPVIEWLELQRRRSLVPKPDEVLIETFPNGQRHHLVAYPFEGRLAHQTLGMLLTRRLDRAGARPLGFIANDYAISVWGMSDLSALIELGRLDLQNLFAQDMLGDDLDAWLAEFEPHAPDIPALRDDRRPYRTASSWNGETGRQMTVSSDLIYDVLRRHDPHHILLQAAYADAATGLLDVARLQDFLRRIDGRIRHIALQQVSPLAVPVLLEMGREVVNGEAREAMLREAADMLIKQAMDAA